LNKYVKTTKKIIHANWTSECGCLIVNMAHGAWLLVVVVEPGASLVLFWLWWRADVACRWCFYLPHLVLCARQLAGDIVRVIPSPHPKC